MFFHLIKFYSFTLWLTSVCLLLLYLIVKPSQHVQAQNCGTVPGIALMLLLSSVLRLCCSVGCEDLFLKMALWQQFGLLLWKNYIHKVSNAMCIVIFNKPLNIRSENLIYNEVMQRITSSHGDVSLEAINKKVCILVTYFTFTHH